MKYHYPLAEGYIRNKGVDFAIQELVSNALDAEIAHDAQFTSEYDPARQRLILSNKNITVSREAFLLGGTDKSDDARMIGAQGEGWKLSALILCRQGLLMKVRNGKTEDWKPTFEFSPTWNARVLTIEVTKASRQSNNFEVEIFGIEPKVWNDVQSRFLHFRKPVHTRVSRSGQILLDEEFAGQIFVKGVLNCFRKEWPTGANLLDVSVGRDRDTLDDYTVRTEVQSIWSEVVQNDETATSAIELYMRLNTPGPEADAFRYSCNSRVIARLDAVFVDLHGTDVVVCASTGEVTEVEHLGARGVLLSETLARLLGPLHKTPATLRTERKHDAVKQYAPDDLPPEEKERLLRAFSVLAGALEDFDVTRVTVVDFRDPKLLGLHKPGGRVEIARKLLKRYGSTLSTLVHEFAHDYGRDGSASHQDRVEQIWEQVIDAQERLPNLTKTGDTPF